MSVNSIEKQLSRAKREYEDIYKSLDPEKIDIIDYNHKTLSAHLDLYHLAKKMKNLGIILKRQKRK